MDDELIKYLQQQFDLPEAIAAAETDKFLAEKINELIQTDFEQLLRLLYRIDVNEKKLRQTLKENPGSDAGKVIAALIIERQLQKIRSRQQSGRDNKNIIDENESW